MIERSANTFSICAILMFSLYLIWVVAGDTPAIYLHAPDWISSIIDWRFTGMIGVLGAFLLSLPAAAFHIRCVIHRIQRPLQGSILGWATVALFLFLLWGIIVVWHFVTS